MRVGWVGVGGEGEIGEYVALEYCPLLLFYYSLLIF